MPEAEAVHQAATSPLNDLPEPTDAQKAAGNYKLGRMRIAGLNISVENPQGSTRRGTDEDGRAWETPMAQAHYGYVRGTTAADGDKLDVFVKPGTAEDYAGPVFVIDQINPKTGKYDEAKAMGKVRRVFLVPTAVCWVSILVGFGALASGVQRLIGIVAVIAAAAYVSSVIGAVIAGRASRRAGPAT